MIRWDRALLVAVKELRDTLRDRRTLLMMVLVPALLYPLGGIAITQLTVSTMERIDRDGYDVAVQGPPGPIVSAALKRDRALHIRQAPDAAATLGPRPDRAAVGLVVTRSAAAPVSGAQAPGAAGLLQTRVEILYDSTSARSRAGLDRVRKALDDEQRVQEEARLRELHLSQAAITPLTLKERSLASEGKTVLAQLAPAIGILLILLSLMGAFYPAIDLIAGERERGTLEPLLATPTSRLEILAGKYACLAVLALATCVLNLASMALTTGFLLGKIAGAKAALSVGVVFLLLIATVPVLLLVSALLLLAAIFARSFKDAQNLMTPVYLACLVPALGALLPESRLTGGTALIPVLSNVLFIKEALGGTLQAGPGFLAIAAGLFYSILAIALAARIFDRPEIIGTRTIDEGLSSLAVRVGRDGRQAVTLTGALGVFGICLALLFHAGTRLQMVNLRLGLLATQVLLLLGPVLLCLRLLRVSPVQALGLHRITPRQVIGAVVAGLGGFGLSLLLSVTVVEPVLHPPEEYLRALQALLPHGARDTVVMLLIAALLPAVCEEVLCRGLLLSAARRVVGAPAAILLAGFAFAVLHLDPYRFPGTFLLGSLLGLVVVRSGSLFPAMIMHFCNNAGALLLGPLIELGERSWHHIRWPLGVALGLVTVAGLWAGLLLVRGVRRGGGRPPRLATARQRRRRGYRSGCRGCCRRGW